MKNARITYFGPKDSLHLAMISLPRGKEIVTRLDNILPQERPQHRSDLLIIGMDGRLINCGAGVPDTKLAEAVAANAAVDDNHTGFFVEPKNGFQVVDDGPLLVVKGKPPKFTRMPAPPSEGERIKPPAAPKPKKEKVPGAKKRTYKEPKARKTKSDDPHFDDLAEGL